MTTEINIMQELSVCLAYLEQNENKFLYNKIYKIMEDLEFYFGSSEYYTQEIRTIINDSQSS